MLDNASKPSLTSADIKMCLRDFQAHRQPRASEAVNQTNKNVRALSLSTPVIKVLIEKVAPFLGDVQINEMSARHIGAEKIEFLPIPVRSTTGTMPFNSTQGITNHESRRRRALLAFPLLSIPIWLSLLDTKSRSSVFQILEAPVFLIWMLEGCRSANYLKPMQW